MKKKTGWMIGLSFFVWAFYVMSVYAQSGDSRDVLEQFFNQDRRSELEKISATPEAMRTYVDRQKNVNVRYEGGKTLLHQAAMKNYADVVRLLLERKADINAADADRRTPLHDAMSYFAADAVAVLIEHGADMNRKNLQGERPLDSIVFWDNEDRALRTVRLFIQKGFNLKKSGSSNLLNQAIGRGREKLAGVLLDNGIAVDDAALTYAAREGYEKIFDLLLEKGVRPSSKNVFHEACQGGSVGIVQKLVSLHLVPSTDDIDACIFYGRKESAEFLNQTLMDRGEKPVELKGRCQLKPDGGVCKANFFHAYYDGKVCREFSYGGCGGQVPFDSLEACQRICEE